MSAYPDPSARSTARRPDGAGVDLPTLLITAAASAGAAYACSKIWAPGTLASAAAMPVLVAVIKEALARPAQAVTRSVPPVRGVVRRAPPPGGSQAPGPPPEPALERVPQPGEVTYHATPRGTRRWRLAIITGLLGFVLAVLAMTVPELIAGGSASGGGRSTTLFGGDDEGRKQHEIRTRTVESRTVTVKTKTVVVPQKTTTAPTETKTVPAPTTTTTTAPTVTAPSVVQPPG